MPRSIRVLVANRPKLMRELIVSTLADEPGVEIVGEVADEAEIAEKVREVSPDLLDHGGRGTGLENCAFETAAGCS